jgi:HSP20 family protein
MAAQDWDLIIWRRANDLLQQAERIHRNFLRVATASQYRATHGRTPSWEPPLNVIETNESLWVVSALAGVSGERIEVRIDGADLVITGERPLPECCGEGQLKLWEIPLGPFERRLHLAGAENLQIQGPVSFRDGLLVIELRKKS